MYTQRTAKKILSRQMRFSTKQVITNLLSRKLVATIIITLLLSIVLSPLICYSLITSGFGSLIVHSAKDVTRTKVAIVFGASVGFDEPSPILRDRLDAAVELYKAKKVSKILVSGDNREIDYNEPITMLNYLLKQEIPESDIKVDLAGNRTYDTCYRAKHIFGVNEAVLVTQEFHLYRALYLCSAEGINVQGYAADRSGIDTTPWKLREFLAIALAVWQVNIAPPNVTGGEKQSL